MGRIVGAFGIQGWAKVKPFSEDPAALGGFDRWVVKGRQGWKAVALEDFALHAKGPVGKLAGCDSREAADALRGAEVAVPRAALGEAEAGTLYQVDLVGLDVVDEGGEKLGTVGSFFETGAGSVMVVEGAAGPRLIPFVDVFVKSVDRTARRITVDWKADYDS
jgi:16S rRNA processing protein RimM